MNSPFHQLSRPALLSLAKALELEWLSLPCSSGNLRPLIPDGLLVPISQELNRLHRLGMTAALIAYTLDLLAAEREQTQHRCDAVDLVWTGEELPGSESRDTLVVAQELFALAQNSILIASYALDIGHKGRILFQVLAKRMDGNAALQVRMFLNVKRPHQNVSPTSILLRQFSEEFRDKIWPGQRLPEVFYDPRSLDMAPDPKACLHAKCIVVDEEQLLVTSANLNGAANILRKVASTLGLDLGRRCLTTVARTKLWLFPRVELLSPVSPVLQPEE
jgi:hypothetical protein